MYLIYFNTENVVNNPVGFTNNLNDAERRLALLNDYRKLRRDHNKKRIDATYEYKVKNLLSSRKTSVMKK